MWTYLGFPKLRRPDQELQSAKRPEDADRLTLRVLQHWMLVRSVAACTRRQSVKEEVYTPQATERLISTSGD